MIISHKYRFIFIKTAKTAGTSLEVYLSGVCGDEDIVTPVDPPEPGHRARNSEGFYNHIGAAEIRAKIGEDIWSRYYKFCFERNPWDKVVSLYFYSKTRFGPPDLSFKDFLARGQLPVDFDKYSLGGRVAVDFIGHYERLAEDFGKVCQCLGIPAPEALPKAKSQYRGEQPPYTAFYDEEARQIVADAFAREIDQFGYRFGQWLDHGA